MISGSGHQRGTGKSLMIPEQVFAQWKIQRMKVEAE